MGHVDNHELGYASRLEKGRAPGDSGAPVMSSKEDFLLTELIGDGNDVGDEFGKSVRRDAGRFAAEIVAALVGNNDAKAGSG